jgi:low temperature requirement protein LtrA
MTRGQTANLVRDHSGAQRVTTIELLYVFTITQLSHHVLGNPSWEGAWQTLLGLLAAQVSALALGVCVGAIVVGVALADRLLQEGGDELAANRRPV